MTEEEIAQDVALLCIKDTAMAYEALKRLIEASEESDAVYRWFDSFNHMLDNPNSYVRTRGLVLIARNARWDAENSQVAAVLDRYLEHALDPKPATARRCIQELPHLLSGRPELCRTVRERLSSMEFTCYPDSMCGLLQMDARKVLSEIKNLEG